LQDDVVGDVAPQQVLAVGEPHRPFRPEHAAMQFLDPGIPQNHVAESFVDDLEILHCQRSPCGALAGAI
jgi:hypothetical protein